MLDVKLFATEDGRIFASLISKQGISGLPLGLIEIETKNPSSPRTETGTFPSGETTTLNTGNTTGNGTENIKVFNSGDSK